jgi:hypothetical protein
MMDLIGTIIVVTVAGIEDPLGAGTRDGTSLRIWPNPVTSREVGCELELQRAGPVSIQVFDVGGRLIRTLLDGKFLGAGTHLVSFPAFDRSDRALESGVYFLKLEAPGISKGKMFVIQR